MKITILCVGKMKEAFYREAVAEYMKRLERYAKIEIVEVSDEPTPESASPAQEEKIKEAEGKRILSRIPEGSFGITLEINGKMMDSVELSETIASLAGQGESHLCFIIGGSLGLSPEVTAKARLHLSFSRMTFPHQLMRVILLEQIYRSFRILRHEPYHK